MQPAIPACCTAARPARRVCLVMVSAALSVSVLAACSDGAGGSANGSTAGSVGGAASADPFAGEPAAIPDRYISTADGATTRAALTAGLDPVRNIIPDQFECHDVEDNDYSAPDVLIQIGDGSYTTSEGGGVVGRAPDASESSGEQVFSGGPLDDESSYLRFDRFGQSFDVDYRGAAGRIRIDCYQAGASAQRAVLQFQLNTPGFGDYTCRDVETDQSVVLQMDARGQYAIGGQVGRVTVSELIERTYGRLEFEGGPFDGQRARYSEEPESGYQSFDVSTVSVTGIVPTGSSSELALVCERLGQPKSFAEYGSGFVDAPVAPQVTLAGFYYREDLQTSSTESYLRAEYFGFQGDGRVFVGVPPVAGIDLGNWMVLNYGNGRQVREFVYRSPEDSLAVGGLAYFVGSEE